MTITWKRIEERLLKEERRFRNVRVELVFPHMTYGEFYEFAQRIHGPSDRQGDEMILAWLSRGRWPQSDGIAKYFLHRRFEYALEVVTSWTIPHRPDGALVVDDPKLTSEEMILEWLLLTLWRGAGTMRWSREWMNLWIDLDALSKKPFFLGGLRVKASLN